MIGRKAGREKIDVKVVVGFLDRRTSLGTNCRCQEDSLSTSRAAQSPPGESAQQEALLAEVLSELVQQRVSSSGEAGSGRLLVQCWAQAPAPH